MLSKKQLFTKGMLDISPHMLSVIPFGIICGAMSNIPLENNCFFESIYLVCIKNKLYDQYLLVS